jgi:hypothetical protein
MAASVDSTPMTGCGHAAPWANDVVAQRRAASRKLETGPAMAIRNSDFGSGGSLPISATPPKMNNVMPCMRMPKYLATMEWENSCNTMEKKTPIATEMPIQA